MKKMYLLCGFFVCDDKNDDLSNRTTGGRMRPRYAAEEKFLGFVDNAGLEQLTLNMLLQLKNVKGYMSV